LEEEGASNSFNFFFLNGNIKFKDYMGVHGNWQKDAGVPKGLVN
jgi:hypothetical protein